MKKALLISVLFISLSRGFATGEVTDSPSLIVAALPGATSQPTSKPEPAWSDQRQRDIQFNKDVAALKPAEPPKEAPAVKGPPLPFHTIEGYGGGAITPMAYLVNPGPKGAIFGLPSGSFSNVIMGKKNLQALSITETLFQRIEIGYALDRFGVGTLQDAIRDATTVDIGNDVYMHNWNIRGQLLEENAFGLKFLPALTAGAQFKYNQDIKNINNKLGGALSGIGYEKDNGVDYTLTASKAIVHDFTFNRPLIVTAGLRNSNASNLGFLGFGNERLFSFEGSVAYVPFDWLLIAYEFRQKRNQYHDIPGLVGPEDNWNAIDVSWIINKNATLVAGWGAFGNMVNTKEDGAWWLQFKYEF